MAVLQTELCCPEEDQKHQAVLYYYKSSDTPHDERARAPQTMYVQEVAPRRYSWVKGGQEGLVDSPL